MTDDERIAELVTAPLVVTGNWWDRFMGRFEKHWPAIQKVSAVIAFLSMITAATTIVLVFQLAVCTNTNLGTRQVPANKDTQAHIDYAMAQLKLTNANQPIRDALLAAITAQREGDVAAEAAAGRAFITAFVNAGPAAESAATATTVYVQTLQADKAARSAHPLGKC